MSLLIFIKLSRTNIHTFTFLLTFIFLFLYGTRLTFPDIFPSGIFTPEETVTSSSLFSSYVCSSCYLYFSVFGFNVKSKPKKQKNYKNHTFKIKLNFNF